MTSIIMFTVPDRAKGTCRGLVAPCPVLSRRGPAPHYPRRSGCVFVGLPSDVTGGLPKKALARSLILHKHFTISEPTVNSLRVKAALEHPEQPAFVINRVRLHSSFYDMDFSPGGLRMLTTPNAGGQSVVSEVLSYEGLALQYPLLLCRTEMDIEYQYASKITDYSVTLMGHKKTHIGVSVTRAMKYKGVFSWEDAERLLCKKLRGVNESSRNVIKEHSWSKQILHVWAEKNYIAQTCARVWRTLPSELKSNTVVIVSVCTNEDIYYEDRFQVAALSQSMCSLL